MKALVLAQIRQVGGGAASAGASAGAGPSSAAAAAARGGAGLGSAGGYPPPSVSTRGFEATSAVPTMYGASLPTAGPEPPRALRDPTSAASMALVAAEMAASRRYNTAAIATRGLLGALDIDDPEEKLRLVGASTDVGAAGADGSGGEQAAFAAAVNARVQASEMRARMLRELAEKTDSKLRGRSAEEVVPVLEAMRTHYSAEAVQKAGCVALRNLAGQLDPQRDKALLVDSMRLVLKAMTLPTGAWMRLLEYIRIFVFLSCLPLALSRDICLTSSARNPHLTPPRRSPRVSPIVFVAETPALKEEACAALRNLSAVCEARTAGGATTPPPRMRGVPPLSLAECSN